MHHTTCSDMGFTNQLAGRRPWTHRCWSTCLTALLLLGITGCEVLEIIQPTPTRRPASDSHTYQPQPQLVGYHATLAITGMGCRDGEEDDTIFSTGSDELAFIYTLLQTDAYGRGMRVANHGWGPYAVVAGEWYDERYFPNLQLPNIPLGHGLVIGLSLVEVEDYSDAQRTMDTINEYATYVELANMANPEPYSHSAIEIAGQALYYAGVALDVVDWADDDDTLADHIDVGDPNLVHNALLSNSFLHNGWVFSGVNNGDHFEYEVNYAVHLQPIYR